MFEGLGKFSVSDVSTFALEDKVTVFFLVISIDNKVCAVVRRASLDLYFQADALRAVFVFIDEFGPKLGADFFLGVGPSFGVIGGKVMYALCFSFAEEFNEAVRDGVFQVGGL